jgi:Protein of Unknown function (DUF2784)
MVYRLLADLIVAVHLGFVLLVVFGGLLVAWRRRLAWLHLPALCWGVGIELAGGVCPLTPLELRLRAAAAQQGYAGGFLEHYLVPAIYPAGLTRQLQILLGLGALVLNLAIYLWLWRRGQRGRPS